MSKETPDLQPFDFLKLLGNELRWKLITTLSRSDYRVQELVAILQQPQNLVSYHLRQLRDLQLVTERRSTADARDIYYSLEFAQLKAFYESLGAALHPGLTPKAPPRAEGSAHVLFLCTENSARSQMAEGILRAIGGEHVAVFSAGTKPSSVHPLAVKVLAEMGIDISQQRAKPIDEFQDQVFDYFITVCDRAREDCPPLPERAHNIHWSLPDPASISGDAEQYRAFERISQQILTRIQYLLAMIEKEDKAA